MPIPMDKIIKQQYKVLSADDIPTTLLVWTQQAKDCYKRNCNCKGCVFFENIETPCQMSLIIPKILKKCGEPI